VLPQHVAVIGHEDDHGILRQPELVQLIDHAPDLFIHKACAGAIGADRFALAVLVHAHVRLARLVRRLRTNLPVIRRHNRKLNFVGIVQVEEPLRRHLRHVRTNETHRQEQRFLPLFPQQPDRFIRRLIIMLVAAIGVVINGATALLFMKGRERDLNIRGAFLHMAADAGVSAGVIVAGFAINVTGVQWIDPMVSLLIVLVIAIGTWGLLRDSLNLSLAAVPAGIDAIEVERFLVALPGVTKVHDLHIWAMSTTETALTAHLVKPDAQIDDKMLARICEELHTRFGIDHSTIQLETGDALCRQESHQTV